ncbi:alpha-L-fucosidase [Mucilaginibacter defluvii]
MRLTFILFWFCLTTGAFAQTLVKTPPSAIDNFMDKRFGMFIHFGPVTLRGTEIGWSRNKEVPEADYDSLYREFNPVLFDADQWVKTAKDAGMKYLVITAKHHDGFLLWPSAVSAYNVSRTPFKKDMVGLLAKACKKQGISFCIYMTVLDWHDPDYPIHSPHDTLHNVKGNMPRFVNTMKNELTELITRYKPDMLWFDGYWEKPWTNAYGHEIYQHIKKLDARIIVNNRLGKESEKLNENSLGDFLTPEQRIGNINMLEPWESCITICNQWAWKPNDQMKSLKECIQTLVKTAGGNGNLLFNVGPMMDGRIEQRQVDRLNEMGNWLTKYGRAIYGTKGGPYVPNDVYAATRKGNFIFIHVFKPLDVLKLPALNGAKVKNVNIFGGKALKFTQTEGLQIMMPNKLPDDNCTVVTIEIDGDAEKLPVIRQ